MTTYYYILYSSNSNIYSNIICAGSAWICPRPYARICSAVDLVVDHHIAA